MVLNVVGSNPTGHPKGSRKTSFFCYIPRFVRALKSMAQCKKFRCHALSKDLSKSEYKERYIPRTSELRSEHFKRPIGDKMPFSWSIGPEIHIRNNEIASDRTKIVDFM